MPDDAELGEIVARIVADDDLDVAAFNSAV